VADPLSRPVSYSLQPGALMPHRTILPTAIVAHIKSSCRSPGRIGAPISLSQLQAPDLREKQLPIPYPHADSISSLSLNCHPYLTGS
jgi:hypothetical protein